MFNRNRLVPHVFVILFCGLSACETTSSNPTGSQRDMKQIAPSATRSMSVAEVAATDGGFNTLAAALEKAGLVETLGGEGPFTVFAPSDAAFAKLPDANLQSLLDDATALTGVLTYHVVPQKLMADDVASVSSLTTVEGSTLTVRSEAGLLMIDGAKVIHADIECANGVIHVIDTVVSPN